MKRALILLLALAVSVSAPAQPAFPALVPMPQEVDVAAGTNGLTLASVAVVVDSSGQPGRVAADHLAAVLRRAGLAVDPAAAAGRIVPIRFMGSDAKRGTEGYVLRVDAGGVTIEATGAAGHFYGVQTLLQLFAPDLLATTGGVTSARLPLVTVRDQPRFRWRGAMLDISRHFFGPDYLKRFMDLLALHKFNVLHLHLTDDPAWRLESAIYTNLNGIGATGSHSDSNAPPALLTRNDVAGLVAYAAERFITIVPEIDMPGHASAATRAYPALDGGNKTFNPQPYGDTNVYIFARDILEETARLFPSPVIHFGGDEVDHKVWNGIDQVRRMMQEERLATTKDVEHRFDRTVADFIAAAGRRPAGWDEIAAAGVTNAAIIFWWRHDKPQVRDDALAAGHEMVMCPRDPCYFDYRQVPGGIGASGWKITNTVENVYNWEPVPAAIERYAGQVLGIQANLWTEHIATVEKLERLTLPRLGALSEVAWTMAPAKGWANFAERLPAYQRRVRALGYASEDVPLPAPEAAAP